MAEILTGIHALLSNPKIYDGFENLSGLRNVRQRLVKEFIKPFPGAKIIDMGCGTGAILEHLPKNIKYIGFDPKNEYIERAKHTYGNKGKFICTDINAFITNNYTNYFDIALALGLLHHLEDNEAKKVFLIAKEVLVKKGSLITIDPVFIKNQNIIARFIISMDRGQNVRTPKGYFEIANSIFSDIDNCMITNLLRIPYAYFIMGCSK